MRRPLEMYTASRIQHIWCISVRKTLIYDQCIFCLLEKVLLGLSTLIAPTVGPFMCVIVLFPLCWFLKGSDNGHYEDVVDSVVMIRNSSVLLSLVCLYIVWFVL